MISETRLCQYFKDIVAIDAESWHERKMGEHIKAQLEKLGLIVEQDHAGEILARRSPDTEADPADNLFAYLPETAPGDPILFAAHLDTVKPGKGRQAVVHEDGTITSAGDTVLGADDGVALAEILELLTVIKEDKLPHPRLEFLIASCEEPYAQGSRLFDFSCVTAKSAYTLDLAGPIGYAAIAAPSILSFTIDIYGKSAHAGFAPEEGIHAIAIAGEAISHIKEGYKDKETTVNIGTIEGGTARNIVPDRVTITGEIRSLSDEKAESAFAEVVQAFEQAAADRGGTVRAEKDKAFSAFSVPENSAVVQRFRKACDALNIPVHLMTTFGGSDNNHVAEHNIPGIVLACAYEGAHTVRESTSLRGMHQTVSILLHMTTFTTWQP